MIHELKRARELIDENGWSGPALEPYCVIRGAGVLLNPFVRVKTEDDPLAQRPMWLPTKNFHAVDPRRHEVVESFSVLGALLQVGLGFIEPFDIFEQIVRPANGLDTWLQASSTRQFQVLDMFAEAIGRSKREARRGR